METIKTVIQFLEASKKDTIDPDQIIDKAITLIHLVERRYCSTNDSYLLELPKEKFINWLFFNEKLQTFEYFLEHEKAIKQALVDKLNSQTLRVVDLMNANQETAAV